MHTTYCTTDDNKDFSRYVSFHVRTLVLCTRAHDNGLFFVIFLEVPNGAKSGMWSMMLLLLLVLFGSFQSWVYKMGGRERNNGVTIDGCVE